MSVVSKYVVQKQCRHTGKWEDIAEFCPKIERLYFFNGIGQFFGSFFVSSIYTLESDELLRLDAEDCAYFNFKNPNNNAVVIEWYNTRDGEKWWLVDIIWRNGQWI